MLSGKTAVITGASRGIGAAIARKLASHGCNVAIIYNGSREKAEAVKDELAEAFAVKAEAYQLNVANLEDCINITKKITEEFDGVDILVNNAGITRDSLIMTMEEKDFDDVLDVNLKGCFNMIKALSRNFIRKKYGKIINVSSVSGLSGIAGQTNYSASKAGIIGLTKAAARELAAKNISCNAVAPGFIVTDMTRELAKDEEFVKAIPLKRLGSVEDVANLAVFLASPASDYITGEVIRVDGGLAM